MKKLILLAISVLISGVALCDESGQSTPDKWEYKIWLQPDDVSIESQQIKIEKQLNALGSEGWELVTVMWKKHSDRTSPDGRAVYYFKRPLTPQKQAQQGGADQPSTAPESKLTDDSAPSAESKSKPK